MYYLLFLIFINYFYAMCIYLITITENCKRVKLIKITLFARGDSLQFCHNAVQ